MLLGSDMAFVLLSKFINILIKIFTKTGLYSRPYFYYICQQLVQLRFFYQGLMSEGLLVKTSQYSKEIYQDYGIRDIQDYYNGEGLCLFQSKLIIMSYFDMRQEYLKYLYQELDRVIGCYEETKIIRILEIGCGNCINLVNLQDKYGSKILLFGQDIADTRISNAQDYFGDKLSRVEFQVQNIVDGYDSPDDYFDMVFTMHCLEQIPYGCRSALQEMYRISSDSVVMIEPIFEMGNMTQKLYLINSDHNRDLLASVKSLEFPVDRLEVIDIQSNPSNQSSIIVLRKKHCADQPKNYK